MIEYKIVNPSIGEFTWVPPKNVQEKILSLDVEHQRNLEVSVVQKLECELVSFRDSMMLAVEMFLDLR